MAIIIILIVYLLTHVFLSTRLARVLPLTATWKTFSFYLIYFLVAGSYLWSRKLPDFFNAQIGDKISLLGGFVIADTYYSVLLIVTYKILFKFYNCFTDKPIKFELKTEILVLVGLLLAINLYGYFNATHQITKEYLVETDKNMANQQLKIIMLSDLHLGKTTNQEFSEELVEKINLVQADLVVLVGDIIDSDLESVNRKNQLAPFKKIKARLGVYAVMGNHEYIAGDAQNIIKSLEANNIKVLINQRINLQDTGIVLVGLDDESRKIKKGNALKSLEGLDALQYNIVLDHQPKRIKEISEVPAIDLLLSGHTHRGQYYPNNYITSLMYANDWGLKKFARLTSIVSSGYGNWSAPLRLGSNPEIVIINLKQIQ